MMLSGQWMGWKEAQADIGRLGEFAEREILVEALKKAGRPIAQDMGDRCPRFSGLTAEDFDVAESKDSKAGDTVTVLVGAHGGKGGRAFIAGFLERGTFKMPARPFMRPAWDSARESYLSNVMKELRASYERAIKRFARKATKAAA